MKRFTDLYHELDASNRTTSKLAALKRYFSSVDAADGAWAVFFLTGNRLKRAIQLKDLRLWAAEACGYPEWMVEECYDHVGDLAETLALLLASRDAQEHSVVDISLHAFVERNLLPLKEMESTEQRERLLELWGGMDASSCFMVNKLITGGFRVGVSKTLVTRALAEVAEIEPAAMAHRLMGTFQPSAAAYRGLFDAEVQGDQQAQ
ncbi:MAG: ATP-dependent DNA ligase, partial [Coraliomargarita sp.]